MKHNTHIEHYTSNKELAEAIGNLRYDALNEFFKELKHKFVKDSENDLRKGRKKLSDELMDISARLRNAERSAEKAWEICKPYMLCDKDQVYHGNVVEINEDKTIAYTLLHKIEDKDGYGLKYEMELLVADLEEEDKSLVSLGASFILTESMGKEKVIKFNPHIEFTQEQLDEIKKDADEMLKKLKWD